MARDFEDHCWKDVVDAEMLEIYEPYRRFIRSAAVRRCWRSTFTTRPMKAATGRFSKSTGGSGSCGENAWNVLEPTRNLFAAARRAGVPVIYTTRHADTGGVHSTHRRRRARPRSSIHQGRTGAYAG